MASLYWKPAWSDPMAMENFFMEDQPRRGGGAPEAVASIDMLAHGLAQQPLFRPMKTAPLLLLAALVVLGLAGCAGTPSDRVAKKQALYDVWPVAVQAKVKAGQVDVGFTPDQVWVALGEPDRKYTRTTAKGTAEIWAYLDQSPSFSIGLGVGGGSFGGGVAISDRPAHDDERQRVIFENGLVSAIESTKKP